jgi:hypothetical protein
MFSENYDYQLELANGLKRIFDYNFVITSEGTLASGLSVLKHDLLTQHNHSLEYAQSLKENIIDPMRVFLENQVCQGRRYFIEIKELEKKKEK